jgi:hypothetical protein
MDYLRTDFFSPLQVYVWHTRTEAPKLQSEKQLNKKGLKSHAGIEV